MKTMRPNKLVLLLVASLSTFTLAAADNTLTPEEQKAGWKLLFDGKSYKNFRDPAKETPPGDSWTIEDGALTTVQKPHRIEDLITAKSYGDFELMFDWKVSEGGNTGLKYRIQRTVYLDAKQNKPFEANVQRQIDNPTFLRANLQPDQQGTEYTVAYELQLIDDLRHADALKGPDRTTGALYSMLGPEKHAAHPAGEWNSAKLVLKGKHFEHWINGELVLSGELDDPKALVGLKERWKNGPAVYDLLANAKTTGAFSLQHHGDKVWFKNLKIRETK